MDSLHKKNMHFLRRNLLESAVALRSSGRILPSRHEDTVSLLQRNDGNL